MKLSTMMVLGCVSSADSMACDLSARAKACRSWSFNAMANRTREMADWMTAAASRIMLAAGDQHRLFA